MGRALKAGDPQTFTICQAMPALGLHSPARSLLCWATPTMPATPEIQTCTMSIPLGHDPKACTALQELHFTGPCPTTLHDLCSAGPLPQGRHSLAQYSLHKPVPLRPAKPGTHTHTHTHNLHSAGPRSPSLSSQGSTDMQDFHSASLRPSDMPSPYSKGPLLHLS
jgi:hypothetical protein